MNEWQRVEGWIDPPGVSWIEGEDAWNFVLYAASAEGVTLLLYDDREFVRPLLERDLDPRCHKSGPLWHCRIPAREIPAARYYAYRVRGPGPSPEHWHRYDPEKILLDPYAKAVFFPPAFDRVAAAEPGPNDGRAPLGVMERDDEFDWGDDRAIRHGSDLVIYELHVRGFTRDPSSEVAADRRGTFLGVIDKIPYLTELGVTAVELMPVFQYDPQEGNYWGYMPLNFLAPHGGYATDPEHREQRNEFRRMVKVLHEAGIEVILDVVYNHTCEGDETWPTYSFRGIDNSQYYIRSPDPERLYADFTGCRNTLDASSVVVRKLITDSLRYWREEMHVDGFRFDLASIFARRADGSVDEEHPPIFGQITSKGGFMNARLIAEPWDAVGTHQLGRTFPGWLWMQWNGEYRDAVQCFLRGDEGLLPELMTRLYGSTDLFPDDAYHACRPWQSVNYVTSHDGSTLHDLVSYEEKHNWVNGHENTDGPQEYRWNCGWEGTAGMPSDVMRLRGQQLRNAFCLLLLSNGAPMFRMGDEFGQTQGGNTNPYNQDNETSWLDWRRREEHGDLFRFVRAMIAFRKTHPSICRSTVWGDDLCWHGTGPDPDLTPSSRELAYCLRGATVGDDDLYVMINGGTAAAEFTVQAGAPAEWRRVVDTACEPPGDIGTPDGSDRPPLESLQQPVAARSVVVLLRRRQDDEATRAPTRGRDGDDDRA